MASAATPSVPPPPRPQPTPTKPPAHTSRGTAASPSRSRAPATGTARAARAQSTYPVLSAKRRHQLQHVDHRDGGVERLRSQRKSACSEHEISGYRHSAVARPLRLVRAACLGPRAARDEPCMRHTPLMALSHSTTSRPSSTVVRREAPWPRKPEKKLRPTTG